MQIDANSFIIKGKGQGNLESAVILILLLELQGSN